MNDKQDKWSEKSDDWLVEVLRRGNQQEKDRAMEALVKKHGANLLNHCFRRLPPGYAEEVYQETWLAIYIHIMKGKPINEGFPQLLFGISNNNIADALDKHNDEERLEDDVPIPEYQGIEKELERKESQQFARQMPFTSPLSECQRVVFALRELHEYSPSIVAKLMGKQIDTIYTHLNKANERIEKHLRNEDYELELDYANQQLTGTNLFASKQKPELIVERFANHINPRLTAEELKPLGLTVEEFQREYVTSLLLPWDPRIIAEDGKPSFLLTRKPDWSELERMLKRLQKNKGDAEQIFPVECLLKIDIDNEHIIVTPEAFLEVLPEQEGWQDTGLSDNTYLSLHRPKMTIPVILGFLDQSLFDENLYTDWPFITDEMGL